MDSGAPIATHADLGVRALLVGERIDTRTLDVADRLARSPLAVRLGGTGVAVLFRYGAVVFFEVTPVDEAEFLFRLDPLVDRAFDQPECEEVRVRIDEREEEGVADGTILLRDRDIERIQLVADILAKSVLLDLYEGRVSRSFERIEPLAANLERKGHGGQEGRELLRHIGATLLSEHKMVGRAEVVDKPDLLWERQDLERLFLRLEAEFEIRERHQALERKLELVSRTARTLVEIQYERRTIRLEWYIILLILVEIVLFAYELFLAPH